MKQRSVRSPSWKYLENQEFWTYSVFAKGGEPTIFGAAPWLPAPKNRERSQRAESQKFGSGAAPTAPESSGSPSLIFAEW